MGPERVKQRAFKRAKERPLNLEIRAHGGMPTAQRKGQPGRKPEVFKINAVEFLVTEGPRENLGKVWDRRVIRFNNECVDDRHKILSEVPSRGPNQQFTNYAKRRGA